MLTLVDKLLEAITLASKKDLGRCKDVANDKSYANMSLPSDVEKYINELDTTDELKELVKYQLLKISKTGSSTVRLDMNYNEFNTFVTKLVFAVERKGEA